MKGDYLGFGAMPRFRHPLRVLGEIVPPKNMGELLIFVHLSCFSALSPWVSIVLINIHASLCFILQNYKYKLTLEQCRGVIDNAGSGKSTYNHTVSLPVVSNQLHLLNQVVLQYLLKRYCIKVDWQSSNLFCPRVSYNLCFPRRLSSKESACQCRRCGFNPWIMKIPWRRKWQPTPIFLLEKSHWPEEPSRLQYMALLQSQTGLSARTHTPL